MNINYLLFNLVIYILLFFSLGYIISLRINLKKKEKERKTSLIRKIEDEARREAQPKIDALELQLKNLEKIVQKEEEKRAILEREITSQRESFNAEKNNRISDLEKLIEKEKENRYLKLQKDFEEYTEEFAEKKKDYDFELKEIEKKLNDFREYENAINEDKIRQLKLESDKEFYKVVLEDDEKEDIELLREIAPRLKRKNELNKLIWSLYYQKPVSEMEKRVLEGQEFSGIYKITSLKTGLVYIGQSTNIKRRWTDHCKTALGAGTLASSLLHTTMSKEGVENFTFEVLQKVEKEKLRESEKFYINLYDTKNRGLNTIR